MPNASRARVAAAVTGPDRSPQVRADQSAGRTRLPWWTAVAGFGAVLASLAIVVAAGGLTVPATDSAGWWVITGVTHLPLVVIWAFLVGGLVERWGYFFRGRVPRPAGLLPQPVPTVCVQLPMYNEQAVAQRAIEAAAELRWPRDRFEIQVLDDSTDPAARAVVDETCAAVAARGVACTVLRRSNRQGYKAGALEEGRLRTSAEFIAIFDADFVPPSDYLDRAVAHFFLQDGSQDRGLALVQAQWGHLNDAESPLTAAQSLWVDDHHTLQMSWRSAQWEFVNFTGTAGVWRASTIEEVGGWRAASLVEDCELSFRHLFAGYRTAFAKDIVAPAELPATCTAYKAQQKRWTQGWVQVQRLHLRTLLAHGRDRPLRWAHLLYHMLITWQWPIWALWIMGLPLLIHLDLWFGTFGLPVGLAVYLLPPTVWLATAALLASFETRNGDAGQRTFGERLRRTGRVVPYLVLSTGMLPHQFCAFVEGLLGPMHSEFERTPKSASITGSESEAHEPRKSRQTVRVHWPYVLAESLFIAYHMAWATVFAAAGAWWPAFGSLFLSGCVLLLVVCYGDHDGKLLFVIDPARVAAFLRRQPLDTSPPAVT